MTCQQEWTGLDETGEQVSAGMYQVNFQPDFTAESFAIRQVDPEDLFLHDSSWFSPTSSAVTAESFVKDKFDQEETVFTPGEPITLALTVTNQTALPMRYSHNAFSPGFSIYQEGRLIWDSNYGWVRPAVMYDGVLEPYETLKFNAVWDGKNKDGTLSPPGSYIAEAGVGFLFNDFQLSRPDPPQRMIILQ